MQQFKSDIGLIGLGTMGKNLALNVAEKGYSVSCHDKDLGKVKTLHALQSDQGVISGIEDLSEFVASIRRPRAILLMVPAGKIVDYVLADLLNLLEPGDIVIDGGNSHFSDTNRRQKVSEGQGVIFLGIGISGGSAGARHGPSMMPGGDLQGWQRVENIFQSIAAKYKGDTCVRYLGSGSVGHYVKMVHNGIEYAMMQLLAETYDVFDRGLELEGEEIAELFTQWNRGNLSAYLVEISAEIIRKDDDLEAGKLLPKILDKSKAKGTGKWTAQDAMNLGVAVPNIDQSVAMRDLSSLKEERIIAANKLAHPVGKWTFTTENIDRIENGLLVAFLITFVQGFAQLHRASSENEYYLKLEDVASIWRAGCIIRAELLNTLVHALERVSGSGSLLLDDTIAGLVMRHEADLRWLVCEAVKTGIPVPVFCSSLAYLDAYRSADLPANLVQAQRDFFGAHTYERKDKDGSFTTDWS